MHTVSVEVQAVPVPEALAQPRPYVLYKRALDVTIALVALVCLAPILAICALAVRLESPGPVLFRQRRVRERGKPFDMLKFRSMYADSDPTAHQDYVAAFINGQAQKEPAGSAELYKLVKDPRVTRTGRWLRKTSLDELPQLFNVLWGEMSLVGPRPPIEYELDHYQPAHFQRLAAKPGITGLWQVSGRSKTTFEEMVALDVEYIRTASLALDVLILLKTIPIVLFAKDAH